MLVYAHKATPFFVISNRKIPVLMFKLASKIVKCSVAFTELGIANRNFLCSRTLAIVAPFLNRLPPAANAFQFVEIELSITLSRDVSTNAKTAI